MARRTTHDEKMCDESERVGQKAIAADLIELARFDDEKLREWSTDALTHSTCSRPTTKLSNLDHRVDRFHASKNVFR